MAGYLQMAALVLLAVILILVLKSGNQPLAMVLTLMVSILALVAAMEYLRPVMDFLDRLRQMGNLQGELVTVLLKVTGISVLTEIAALVCADSGNASLGQGLRILSTGVILSLSIPVFQVLLDLVQKILEGSV